ncbi:MAG: bifunctional DNA primase/polymerase [Planctomycetota bacterium]
MMHEEESVKSEEKNTKENNSDHSVGLSPENNLDWALRYLSLGWPVFPVGWDEKKKTWKKPLVNWKKFQTELPTKSDVRGWWKQWPASRIGIVTGKISGIVVVDIDSHNGGSTDGLDLPATLISKTGGGGWHYIYRHPGKNQTIADATNWPNKGIDIRGDGGFIVAPPSLHVSGKCYEWATGLDPELIADCPAWLVERDFHKSCVYELLDGVPEGQRNDAATRVTGLILSKMEIGEFDTLGWGALMEWNKRNTPPMDEKELLTVFSSIKTRELAGRREVGDTSTEQPNGGPRDNGKFFRYFLKKFEISFYRDAKRDGFVRIKNGDASKLISSESKELNDLYRDLSFEMTGKPLTENKVKEAMSQLSAHARRVGELIEPRLRVAREGDACYYDLANEAGECVKINATGWQIVTNPGLPLITSRVMSEQIHPVEGGDVNDLFRFINVKDADDRLLFIAALTACFIYDFPHPVLIIHGPKGSAKTSAMRLIKALVDPSAVTSVHLTKDPRDLAVNFNSSWVVPFDNVSNIEPEVSDALSKVVTGDSFSIRGLYTDKELNVMTFQRCLIINGINNPVKKPDLLDRSILIEIDRIPDNARMTEAKLKEELHGLLPKILGSLFDLTSRALAALPTVPRDNLARLADFDIWGRSVSTALLGTPEPFKRAYGKNINRQSNEAMQQSPFAEMFIEFLKDTCAAYSQDSDANEEQFEVTPTELFNLFRRFVNNKNKSGLFNENKIPKSVGVFSRKINEFLSDFLNLGFRITNRNTGAKRLITIKNLSDIDNPQETSTDAQGNPSKILSQKDISCLRPLGIVTPHATNGRTDEHDNADDTDSTDDKKLPL